MHAESIPVVQQISYETRDSEGPGLAGEVGLHEIHEVQQGQLQGPARGSG